MYRVALAAVLSIALVVYVSLSLPGWVYNRPDKSDPVIEESLIRSKKLCEDLESLSARKSSGVITQGEYDKEFARMVEECRRDTEGIYARHGKAFPGKSSLQDKP